MKIEGASRAGEIPLRSESVPGTGSRVVVGEGACDPAVEIDLHVVHREREGLFASVALPVEQSLLRRGFDAEKLTPEINEQALKEEHRVLLVGVVAPALRETAGPTPQPRNV